MSNNLEYMREHNCKHLKNCSHASVVEYQYSDDKKERMNNMKKLFVSVPMKGRRKRNQRKHSEDEENRRDLRGRRTGTD